MPPRPLLEDPEPRRRLAQIAAGLAGAQPRVMVAVTGTNGKTSTVEFLRQIWVAGGKPAASLGTLGLIAPGFDPGPGLTTPDPVSLAQTLAGLARAGVQHAAMEASSHGLDQFRLDGVRLAAAAFTNLTRDHLDYHGSVDAYRAAKLRLFAELLPSGAPVVASSDMDAGDACRAGATSRPGGGWSCARWARRVRRSACWRPRRVPTDRCCASRPPGCGTRSCCRCRVASRPTTR